MTEPAIDSPIVTVLIPSPMRGRILSAESERDLASFAHIANPQPGPINEEDLPSLLDGAVACVTGWGTPPLTAELIAGHPSLSFVAHTAGSIHRLVPVGAMENSLRVSHAAAIIADAVAELVISQALLCLRQLHEIDRGMKAGDDWHELRRRFPGRLLASRRVGVVGAGYVGRKVIALFQAFGCPILVADPLLSSERAAAMGVELTSLDRLCARSDVISLHAPVLPETTGIIGRAQLRSLKDGCVFINAARAALVDESALFDELRTSRFVAALDVFEQEPLPADSPFRSLPNVILSPHTAGQSIDTYLRQGQAMVEETARFLRGEPLQYEVSAAMLPTMA